MQRFSSELGKKLLEDNPEVEARIAQGTELYRKGTAKITLQFPDGQPVEHAEIEFRQKTHQFDFGCNAFFYRQFEDRERNDAYEEIFSGLFNLAVIPFYWDALEPEDGRLRFDRDSPPCYRRPPIDSLLDFCEKYRIRPKGHPLCWHQFTPYWLSLDDAAPRLERRIREIAERYGRRIRNWDVVNEALAGGINSRMDKLPRHHVELAFEMAKKYFPVSSCFNYNEIPHYCWDTAMRDYSPLYMLVKEMLRQGLKVDGLGLQYHLFGCHPEEMAPRWNDYILNPVRMYACMDQYQKLDIPFNISEITITAHRGLGADSFELQAALAEKLYRIWFSHPAADGIIYWNLVDNTACPSASPNNEAWNENIFLGGLLNNDMTPKPAFTTIRNLIQNEWRSTGSICYDASKNNYFRGFFGEYDATVKTEAGIFQQHLSIRKDKTNEFILVVQ